MSRTPQDSLIPIFVLGVPIFDTTLVTISRSRRGLIPFTTPGKDHTAHRLSNCGLGTRRAVLTLYLLGGVFGLLALAVGRLDSLGAAEFAAGVAVIVLIAVAFLEKAPYERQQRKPKAVA